MQTKGRGARKSGSRLGWRCRSLERPAVSAVQARPRAGWEKSWAGGRGVPGEGGGGRGTGCPGRWRPARNPQPKAACMHLGVPDPLGAPAQRRSRPSAPAPRVPPAPGRAPLPARPLIVRDRRRRPPPPALGGPSLPFSPPRESPAPSRGPPTRIGPPRRRGVGIPGRGQPDGGRDRRAPSLEGRVQARSSKWEDAEVLGCGFGVGERNPSSQSLLATGLGGSGRGNSWSWA